MNVCIQIRDVLKLLQQHFHIGFEEAALKFYKSEMQVAPLAKGKPIYYEFTACPVAEFARKYGLEEIAPALCNVDYPSMELIHAKLIRTSTCVDGCKCDYTICGDRDPDIKEHPEYRDEAGYRKNK